MVDDGQIFEQLWGRVVGEQLWFIPVDESGGPGFATGDPGLGRDMDGSFGRSDADAL